MSRLTAPFTDPKRRPRTIVWGFVVIIVLAAVFAVSMAATSTFWFCNDVCHTVHADNKQAYYDGVHDKVSCVACHYPPNMNVVALSLDRMDKLLDIAPTISGDVEMPLNGLSRLALTTPDDQCTQCHDLAHRPVSPQLGVVIDHDVHTESGIVCATCHNRVAHPEDDIEFTLPGNGPKADFMKMTSCYRCHSLTGESPSEFVAPGTCATCHDAEFNLYPASHTVEDWYNDRGASRGHAEAATEEASSTAEVEAEWDEVEPGFWEDDARPLVKLAGVDESVKTRVPPPGTINECFTCHIQEEFCDVCHGIRVPHAADFVESHGGELNLDAAASCAVCHNKTGDAANDALTCTLCHHGQFDPAAGPWGTQHPLTVAEEGTDGCFECHEALFCASCHVSGKPATPY